VAAQAGEASAAGPGLLVDGRYRLDQVRAEHRPQPDVHAALWRAADIVLERPVAILLVTGLNQRGHTEVVAAAARASQVSDARFVRVLDVGRLDPPSNTRRQTRTTWIATEWVDAPSLAASVRGDPLHPAVATEVTRQCAEALEAAAAADCVHGRLHPGQVLLPEGGVPRITGLGLAAAIEAEGETPDVAALGGVLFAGLTGRWPLPGWSGLPSVDARAASATRPRLIRAGISRELDETTHRMLTGVYPDAHACVRALSLLPGRALDRPAAPAAEPGPSAWRRWSWRIVPPVVIIAIGATGWAVGSELGRVPSSARQQQAQLPPAHASAPGGGNAHLVWRHAPTSTGFDPGGDGEENDDEAGLAVDRDRSTAWTTDLYHGDSHLGGLKAGVGLLLDLGKPQSVQVAALALSAAGSDVEIRAGDQAPTAASDLPLVARRDQAPQRTKLSFDHPVRARYWLVWFTNLPPDSGGFRIGVVEVALLG
jgi:putative peptidoglycan lipid II flippase